MELNDDNAAFSRFCVKNLLELKNVTDDDMKKAHLQRKINVQMYHEACAR